MVKVTFDCKKLRLKIIEKFNNIISFAEALGKSPSFVSITLNGKRSMTRDEIAEWAELLEIDIADIGLYFFCT